MKVYRPGRCELCGKREQHAIHQVAAPLPWWKKMLRLAWPRWMWQKTAEGGSVPHPHKPDDRDRVVTATDSMAELRRFIHKKRRRQ